MKYFKNQSQFEKTMVNTSKYPKVVEPFLEQKCILTSDSLINLFILPRFRLRRVLNRVKPVALEKAITMINGKK